MCRGSGRRGAALERRRRREEVLQQLEKGDLTSLMGDLPSWITFPDVERSRWLNLALGKLWPHIDAATCSILRNVVEFQLQRAIRGKGGVHSVVFNNLSLGPKPPFIGGVRSFEHRGDSVICDVELRWVAAAVAATANRLLRIPSVMVFPLPRYGRLLVRRRSICRTAASICISRICKYFLRI